MTMPHASAAHRPIQFFHRDQTVSVTGLASTTTVLSWLRERAHCSDVKEGCNEGDCGACTVLVGELAADGSLHYKPMNSCLQFLPTLDGKALLTAADLGGTHPVQQSMVDCHGSQCGFCTPGFVMSLTACYERHRASGQSAVPPSRQQIADDLSGNLCRCTGYRTILDAGEQMFKLPVRRLETARATVALKTLRSNRPLHYADATPFHAPRTVGALATLAAAKPEARLLAGGTDIALWVNKQFKSLGEIIFLGEVAALKTISIADGWLEIGAGASLETAWGALARHWPAAQQMGLRFASLPVREAGTMGGNIANGSPIGDGAPVLIALGAQIVLRHGDQQRTFPLQDFYLDYLKNQLQPGEFVRALRVPLPKRGELLRVYKLSKRHDSDISGLAAGLWLRMDGDTVADLRWAFGGMAAIVKRATGAETAVRGQRWSEATLQAASIALDADFSPLSDLRASASYRRRAARGLLRRLWLETRGDAPLVALPTSVWSL